MTDTQRGKPANESRPPAWARCGNCRWCQRYDEAARYPAIYDPFFFMRDLDLGNRLRKSCGICAERDNDPVVVGLDTREGDMPCQGFGWGLAGDGPQEPS